VGLKECIEYYHNLKEWSIYPFIPPIFSLLLSLVILPVYEKLIDTRIKEYLGSQGLKNDSSGNKLDLVKSVIKTRGLQVAYLTELPTFAIAIISTAQGNYPRLVLLIWCITIIITLLAAGNVFIPKPGYLATTQFPKKRRPRWLAWFGLKQIHIYAALLPILTIALILIIVITLPEKKSTASPADKPSTASSG
jgi:hypothetical protein